VDRHLRTLDRDENHHLKQVPCPVRPDDEPTVWILSGILGARCLAKGMEVAGSSLKPVTPQKKACLQGKQGTAKQTIRLADLPKQLVCGRKTGDTGATGLEPATSAVTGQRSNLLSYAPAMLGYAGATFRASSVCQGLAPVRLLAELASRPAFV
jgi:hypothetical protein